jgi:hypothetical protein
MRASIGVRGVAPTASMSSWTPSGSDIDSTISERIANVGARGGGVGRGGGSSASTMISSDTGGGGGVGRRP